MWNECMNAARTLQFFCSTKFLSNHLFEESKTYYVKASHATGCNARPRSTTPTFVQKFQDKFAYTPSASAYFQGASPNSPIPTSAEPPRSPGSTLTPEPLNHRPLQPIGPPPTVLARPAIQTTTNVRATTEQTSTMTSMTSSTFEQ